MEPRAKAWGSDAKPASQCANDKARTTQSHRKDTQPPKCKRTPAPIPRPCDAFGREIVVRSKAPQAKAWGSDAKPATHGDTQNGVKRRNYDVVNRLNVRLGYAKACGGVVHSLFFTNCGDGFQPSPKLKLGAPLRRHIARTTN